MPKKLAKSTIVCDGVGRSALSERLTGLQYGFLRDGRTDILGWAGYWLLLLIFPVTFDYFSRALF